MNEFYIQNIRKFDFTHTHMRNKENVTLNIVLVGGTRA